MNKLHSLLKLENLVLVTAIIYTSGTFRYATTITFLLIYFFLSFSLFVRNKRSFDNFYFVLIAYLVIVNLISRFIVNTNQEIDYMVIFSYITRFSAYYFMVKGIGLDFIDKLLKILSHIIPVSLVWYLINISIPGLFDKISFLFDWYTMDLPHWNYNYWNSFYYTYAGKGIRNCGFMWEPGGYGFIMVLYLTIRLSKGYYILDKTNVVAIISLLTTQSTSAYLSLFLIGTYYYLEKIKQNKKINIFPLILAGLIVAYSVYAFKNLEFMGGKIDGYIEGMDNKAYRTYENSLRVNRFKILEIQLDSALNWPFGNGYIENSYKLAKYGDVDGTNGVGLFIYRYGIIVLFLIMYYLYRLFYVLNVNVKKGLILSLALWATIFSNPSTILRLFYPVLFYSIIYQKKYIKHVSSQK